MPMYGPPGHPSNYVRPGPEWIGKALSELQRQIDELKTARSLEASTIGRGGIVVSGGSIVSSDFDGDLDAAGPGTAGWALGGKNSNAVFNVLALRGGIVGNDALANPVSPAVAHQTGAAFSLSTTAAPKATATINVPAGFSRALVLATMSATGVNTTAAQDFFDGYADINAGGAPGGFDAAADGAPGYAVGLAHTSTALLTGLGSSFTVRAMLRSGNAAWSASGFNACNIDALVLFLR